jgi:hypothetical protein
MAGDALGTLKKVRQLGVEKATRALGESIAATRAASLAARSADEAVATHAARVSSSVEDERKALDRGELQASDLEAGEAWHRQTSKEHDALAASARRARDTEAGAASGERRARADLAARSTDVEVVAAVVSRRDAAERKTAELRAEEAASEAWRPRR